MARRANRCGSRFSWGVVALVTIAVVQLVVLSSSALGGRTRAARTGRGTPYARKRQAERPATLTKRVFIAAYVRLYREALAEILARVDGIVVVGTAGNRPEILAQVGELEPDVVLLDPAVPGSMDAIRELVHPAPCIRVVVLASSENEREVIAFAEAGVSGFVTRDDSLIDLVAVIRCATQGDLLCSPRTAGTLLRRVTALAAEPPPGAFEGQLTPRELEVVQLIDEGLSNKQIAFRLHVELPTVKHHVHHILEKIGVARRSEAVAHLRQHGLLRTKRL